MAALSNLTLKAKETALQAGQMLKEGFFQTFKIKNKEGSHNLVTDYDFKSEKFIISALKKEYPDHSFIAEEKGFQNINPKTINWIIDPLDGTVNFAHRIPFFSVSIAAFQEGQIISGVVYSPMTEELFIAEKNQGAYLNDKPLSVSKCAKLEDGFLATGFPYRVKENPDHCYEHFLDFLKMGLPIRRLGSAALDLSYVAAGRFDAFWETLLGPWDCAAGYLLVSEAKGKMTDWKGEKWQVQSSNKIVASNGLIHDQMVNLLKKH